MRKLTIILAVLGLFAAAVAIAADGVTFAYKFEAGSSQRYRVHMNIETDFGGALMSQLADMEVTLKCVTPGEAVNAMEMVIDKAEMSRAMFGNNEVNPEAAQLVGKSVVFNVDVHGKVTDIKPGINFSNWDTQRSMIEPIIENWFVYLPGSSVAAGGEWKKENDKDKESGMEMTTNSVFKFKSMKKEKERDCAVIESATTTDMGGTVTNPMGQMTVDGEGKGKYEFLFDPASGVVVRMKGQTDVEMEMTPVGKAGDPVQTVIGIKIERELL